MHVSQAGSRVSCRGVVGEGLPAGGRVEHCAVCACMYMYVPVLLYYMYSHVHVTLPVLYHTAMLGKLLCEWQS